MVERFEWRNSTFDTISMGVPGRDINGCMPANHEAGHGYPHGRRSFWQTTLQLYMPEENSGIMHERIFMTGAYLMKFRGYPLCAGRL